MLQLLAKHCPFLVTLRRYLYAAWGAWLPARKSYSFSGEDLMVASHLPEIPFEECVYVDVGANHPTKISNTYLFYRRGARGIIIEPNRAFRPLYRIFRPRDIFLGIGCAQQAGVLEFFHSSATVLAGFTDRSSKGSSRSEYLPVLPLDAVLPLIGSRRVFLLSIDAEGMDLEILRSGQRVLEKTDVVLVEFGEQLDPIADFLASKGFTRLATTSFNLIFGRSVK